MKVTLGSQRKMWHRAGVGIFHHFFGLSPVDVTVVHRDLVKDRLVSLAKEELLSSELGFSRFERAFTVAVEYCPFIHKEDQLEIFVRAGRQLGQQCLALQQQVSSERSSS